MKATLENILKDPNKFSLPTYDQFKANPDQYRTGLSREEILATIDRGSQNLGKVARKYIFEVEGYRFTSLEKAEQACRDMGIKVDDYVAEVLPTGGGWGEIKVKFISKADKARRDKW